MKKLLFLGGTLVALFVGPGTAFADGQRLGWREMVGIIQAGNTVGSGTGKVRGGLLPWHTKRGRAVVNLETGELRFAVRGLVLAGGNPIGTGVISATFRGR